VRRVDLLLFRSSLVEGLERWKDSTLYQMLLSILGEGIVDRTKIAPAVLEAVGAYHDLRDRLRYLDYTTMIAEAVAEIKHNESLRARLSEQLKYLVVDEYQDINPLQEELIRRLHELGTNVCVVGDDDQTIYQWRGSEIRHILQFADTYPDVHEVNLNENFRSSEGVIGAARAIAEALPERLPKKWRRSGPAVCQGRPPRIALPQSQEEAAWIAAKIASLLVPHIGNVRIQNPGGLRTATLRSSCAVYAMMVARFSVRLTLQACRM